MQSAWDDEIEAYEPRPEVNWLTKALLIYCLVFWVLAICALTYAVGAIAWELLQKALS